jgi:hypothetical protein
MFHVSAHHRKEVWCFGGPCGFFSPRAEPLPPHLPYATTLCCRNISANMKQREIRLQKYSAPSRPQTRLRQVSYLCTEGGRPSGGDPKSTVADVDANSTLLEWSTADIKMKGTYSGIDIEIANTKAQQ